ncbi:MAG: DUF4422 domain-containing protein [Firmicutes bacterium]|nr:DUF4422 domain-containing protein [Bacillota bacterium]MCL1953370.1 DUF4422 domain-containing protein [Bacillota bacterium]
MNSKKDILILVCCHKKSVTVRNDILNDIAVGVANSKQSFECLLKDNTHDNISTLNNKFCEMTAIYWAFKNINADYYGLFHYRRYLDLNSVNDSAVIKTVLGIDKNFDKRLGLQEANIVSLMKKYDVILPAKWNIDISIYQQYKKAHDIEDLDFCINYIRDKYPQYNNAIETYLHSTNLKHNYFNNMFILRRDLFLEYCNWIFDILFAFDKQKDYFNVDDYEKRVVGFLAERLFGVFVVFVTDRDKSLRVGYADSVFVQNTDKKLVNITKIKRRLKRIVKGAMPYSLVRWYQKSKDKS